MRASLSVRVPQILVHFKESVIQPLRLYFSS
jgi:hypothetical protein